MHESRSYLSKMDERDEKKEEKTERQQRQQQSKGLVCVVSLYLVLSCFRCTDVAHHRRDMRVCLCASVLYTQRSAVAAAAAIQVCLSVCYAVVFYGLSLSVCWLIHVSVCVRIYNVCSPLNVLFTALPVSVSNVFAIERKSAMRLVWNPMYNTNTYKARLFVVVAYRRSCWSV